MIPDDTVTDRLIDVMGSDEALTAHLAAIQPGELQLPGLVTDAKRAIAATAEGRPDEVVWYDPDMDDGIGMLAFLMVRYFRLDPWVVRYAAGS